MKTIYSEQHRLRDAKTELYGGELVQPFERPSRADIIIKALVESGFWVRSAIRTCLPWIPSWLRTMPL